MQKPLSIFFIEIYILVNTILVIHLRELHIMRVFYIFFAASCLLSTELKADLLRDLVDCYYDHIEEEYKRRSTYAKQRPNKGNEKSANVAKENLGNAQAVRSIVNDYLNNKITADDLLGCIMYSRFKFLKMRRQNYISSRNELKITSTLKKAFLATRSETVEMFRQKAEEYPDNPMFVGNYSSVLCLIDTYQINSKIIAEVFNRHPLGIFSEETLRLLRMSVTLHPLLRGESDDWLHPDYAFLSQVDEPKHLFGKRDMDYYVEFAEVSKQTVQLMNWTRSYIEIFATNAEVGKTNLEFPPLSCLRRGADEELNITQPLTLVDTTPKKASRVKNKNKKQKNSKKDFRSISPRSEQSFEPIAKELKPNISGDVNHNQVPLVLDLTPPTQPALPLTDITNVASLPKQPSEKKIPNENQNLLVKVEKEENALMPPRGIRIFHDQRNTGEVSPIELPNKLQSVVDSLFDPQQFQTVSYGEFATVWNHINGEKSIKSPGSGGSHRALLNAQGHVVGSTFAHGDRQTYGPKTVKYLRDALLNVGVRPLL